MKNRQSIKELTNKIPPSGSYSDSLEKQRQTERAKEILKYGGGGVKKLLFGMTSVLFGKDAASKIATRFRDVEKTEQAHRTIHGIIDSPRTPKSSVVEKIIDNVEIKKIKESLDGISSDVKQSLETLGRIESRISPKELTVGKGEAAQTFRFDPLAPEGRQVTAVTASGKSGRFASRKEASMVLSKAAYLGAPQTRPTGTIQQLKNTKEVKDLVSLLKQSFDEKVKQEKNVVTPKERKERPIIEKSKTYNDFLQEEKEKQQALKAIRYGGRGLGRRMAFGLTSFLVGEKLSEKIATKFRNKKETQSAFETLMGEKKRKRSFDDLSQGVTGEAYVAPGATKTQLLAAKGKERARKEELEEEEKEFKEDIIERLERIEKKIDDKECSASSAIDVIGAAAAAAAAVAAGSKALVLGGLAAIFYNAIKEGGNLDDISNKLKGGDLTEEEKNALVDEITNIGSRTNVQKTGGPAPNINPEINERTAEIISDFISDGIETSKEKISQFLEWMTSLNVHSAEILSSPIPEPAGSQPVFDENTPENMERLDEQFESRPIIDRLREAGYDVGPPDVQQKPSIDVLPSLDKLDDSLNQLQIENERLREAIDNMKGGIDSSMTQQQSPPVVALQPIVNNNTIPVPQQQKGATVIHVRTADPTIGYAVASMFDHPTEHYKLFS